RPDPRPVAPQPLGIILQQLPETPVIGDLRLRLAQPQPEHLELCRPLLKAGANGLPLLDSIGEPGDDLLQLGGLALRLRPRLLVLLAVPLAPRPTVPLGQELPVLVPVLLAQERVSQLLAHGGV